MARGSGYNAASAPEAAHGQSCCLLTMASLRVALCALRWLLARTVEPTACGLNTHALGSVLVLQTNTKQTLLPCSGT